jgi:acetyl esterase/lipase
MAAALAQRGFVAVSINYRLAKADTKKYGNKYGVSQTNDSYVIDAVHDLKAAIRFMRRNAAEWGVDPTRIGAGGESAGGIATEFLGFVPVSEGASGNPGLSSHVSVTLPISGALVFDTACTLPHGAAGVICNGTLPPGTWNLTSDIGRTNGQPPVVMVHGTHDTVVPYREALAVQMRAAAANISNLLVSVPGAGHVPYEQLLGIQDSDPAVLKGSAYMTATMRFIYQAMDLQSLQCPKQNENSGRIEWGGGGATKPLKTDDAALDPVLVIHVAPVSPTDDGTRSQWCDGSQNAPLHSLQDAADRVAVMLRTPSANPQDIVVQLQPGAHRVPSGGLLLAAEHSPAPVSQQWVIWRAAEAGRTSIHGGVAITGWHTVKNDPTLPAGVMVAAVPAALKGKRLRHLYVDGVRAARTRVPAAYLNLTLTGNSVSGIATSGCNLTGSWGVGGRRHFAEVVEGADGGFTATAHGVPKGGWTSAQGIVSLNNGTVTVTFNNGRGSDHATLAPPCDQVHWANYHRHPAWHRTPAPAPPAPPGPPVPSIGNAGYRSSSSEAARWTNAGDVEFVYSGVASNWAESRCTVANVSAVGGAAQIALKEPCQWNLVHAPWHPIGNEPPAFVENVRQHLTERGSFYYDLAKGEVLYFPRTGEDMSALDVVIPVEETLVHLNGSSKHSWENIVFEYATWLRPMEGAGFVEGQSAACAVCPAGELKAVWKNRQWQNNGPFPQGCGGGDTYATTPGNVIITAGKDISFSNCTFQHLGAFAASAAGGSQRVSWSACTFTDVSAGALMLGDLAHCAETDMSLWDTNFTVSDNTITNMPVEYTGATSLFLAYVHKSSVEHNYIANTSYSAMTIGWGWGRTGCR